MANFLRPSRYHDEFIEHATIGRGGNKQRMLIKVGAGFSWFRSPTPTRTPRVAPGTCEEANKVPGTCEEANRR